MTSEGGTETYTLDALNRVTAVSYPNGDNVSYAYDANGNRNVLTLGIKDYANTLGAASNRLLSVAGPSARTYSYNNAGSLLGDGYRIFSYDGGNRD